MTVFPSVAVGNLEELLEQVRRDTAPEAWRREGNVRPWFRGQADAGEPPLPSVFRHDVGGRPYDEFRMTTAFRLKALAFRERTPETDRLDQWLFPAQHYGLPTRLLDWTESPLLACFFAVAAWLDSEKPEENYGSPDLGIWLMHPIELNRRSKKPFFPNTWKRGEARDNFRMAFHSPRERSGLYELPETDKNRLRPSDLPLAVQASAVDPRVVVQRSCFTVHGRDEADFETIALRTGLNEAGFFRKYKLPRMHAAQFLDELLEMGVSFTSIYPDLTGLPKELRLTFGPQPLLRSCGVCDRRKAH